MHDLLFVRIEQDFNYLDPFNSRAQCLLSDSHGKILEYSGRGKKLENIFNKNLSTKKVILIIPDHWVSFHVVDIPIKEYKKRLQALPYILEEKIISNVENTIFTLGPQIYKNKYLVAVSDKEKINNILAALKSNFNVTAASIITDAVCLYATEKNRDFNNSDLRAKFKIFLNKDNNLALIITDNIIVSPLNNLDIIFTQINDKISADIYKNSSDNIFHYLVDGSNVQKLIINSEQEIDDWLPFLVREWFKNNPSNKREQINIASGLVGSESLDIKFNQLWPGIIAVWCLLLFAFVGYKYYENSIYSNRNIALNKVIKQGLSAVDINAADLTEAKKLIDFKINNLESAINTERAGSKFYILLSSFASNFVKNININKISFNNDVLEINFNIEQKDMHLLDKIKNDFNNKKITLKDNIINADNATSAKNIIWILSF